MNFNQDYKLGDDVIVELRSLLQICMLTGTDIIDHLRMVRLEVNNNEVNLTDDYSRESQDNIGFLMKLANASFKEQGIEEAPPVTPEERETFDSIMAKRFDETGE